MLLFTHYAFLAAVTEVQSDLHTTAGLIALSLSVPIVVQGGAPVIWCAVSEIIGRKVSPSTRFPVTFTS